MNTKFEFADKFGFEQKFDFDKTPNEDVKDKKTLVVKKTKLRKSYIFLTKERFIEKYKGKKISRKNENYVIFFIEVSRETYLKLHETSDSKVDVYGLKDLGISFKDIKGVFDIQLGKLVIDSMQENEKYIDKIINRSLEFLDVDSSNEKVYKEKYRSLIINEFVQSKLTETPEAIMRFIRILQMCLEQGFKEIGEKMLSPIIDALKKLLREDEKYWNPFFGKNPEEILKMQQTNSIKYSSDYDPFFEFDANQSEVLKSLDSYFEPILSAVKRINGDGENSTRESTKKENFTMLISDTINWCKETIAEILSSLDKTFKYLNAVIVGLYNGLVKIVIGVFEFALFVTTSASKEGFSQLVEAITTFFEELNWDKIKTLIKDAIKDLFKFVDEDQVYKNAYEFGLFIPELIQIILDVIMAVKGGAKLLKDIADIIKDKAREINADIAEYSRDILKHTLDDNIINDLAKYDIETNRKLIYKPCK